MRITALLTLLAAAASAFASAPASADIPKVVTDFGPTQSLVMDVMGSLGTPQALLPRGGDPHDFQLRPSQADALAKADVVFWIGPELMPALADALTALASQARTVALLHTTPTRSFAEGGLDPHAWLDVTNGIAWLDTIADTLAAKDPENAATYHANAKAMQDRLTADDTAWRDALTKVGKRPFVAYHDALGYFTTHFNLTMVGAIELSDATPPSAARLSEIQGIITTGKAVCVFPEAGRDPKFITTLTDGLPVRVGKPQDVEFITTDSGAGQYELLLQHLVLGLAECLTP